MKIYLFAVLALCGCKEAQQPEQPEVVDAATQRLRDEVYDDIVKGILARENLPKKMPPLKYNAKDFIDQQRPAAPERIETEAESMEKFSRAMKDADIQRRVEALEATQDQH